MIKAALEYLMNQAKATTTVTKPIDMYGREYFAMNGDYEMIRAPRPNPLRLHYLDGLADYVNSSPDGYELGELMIVVQSPTDVRLVSRLDDQEGRDNIVDVSFTQPNFKYGVWYGHEEFVINLMTMFIPTEDLSYLIKTASNINVDHGTEVSDDGVTQRVAVRKGITTMSKEFVKSRVVLKPIRTFKEIVQPESDFIFRVKEENGQLSCALFEADGEMWQLDALKCIRAYLRANIAEVDDQRIDIFI